VLIVLPFLTQREKLTRSIALHRHRKTQAVEESEHARSEPTEGGLGSAVERSGQWPHQDAKGVRGRVDELEVHRDVSVLLRS